MLPVLLLVTLALVQVGLLARDRLLLEQAARAAAREAAVQADLGAVRAAALAAAPGLDGDLLELTMTAADARGSPVSVSLRYPAPIRVPFVDALFPDTVVLETAAAARREYP